MLTIIDEYSRFPFAYPVKDISSSTFIKCLTHLFSIFAMPSFIHSDRGPSLISKELKNWLFGKGVATSRTTPYNPTGNAQVERYNRIIWMSIQLVLKTRKLPDSCWERALPDILHSIRSLLCTATNCIPHERFFNYQRRSACGESIPSWLAEPRPVLMKRNVRRSKYEPLTGEVELLEANPQYAYVRLPDGRETTVSVKQLAPAGSNPITECQETDTTVVDFQLPLPSLMNDECSFVLPDSEAPKSGSGTPEPEVADKRASVPPRRSDHDHKAPDQLNL